MWLKGVNDERGIAYWWQARSNCKSVGISDSHVEPECRSRLQQGCVFLSDPYPESKFCYKQDLDPESLLNFSSSKSLGGHFLMKTWVNFGFIDGSRSLILKFKRFSNPDSNFLEQEWSLSLKKWFQSPLVGTRRCVGKWFKRNYLIKKYNWKIHH